MKSKTSFCNLTLLKKDFTRFSPLWILLTLFYSICTYLIYQSHTQFTEEYSGNFFIFGWAAFGFALCSAVTLFGYLDEPRECVMMHALPVKRETLFFTHLISGFLMHLIPTALFFLVMIPISNITLLPQFAAIEMQYVFHYALAVFSMILTGKRFSGVVIYGLISFFAPILYFTVVAIYQPLLPGIDLQADSFLRFCPPIAMVYNFWNNGDWKFQENWPDYLGYLSIWVILGGMILIGSFLLYRIRKLEQSEQFLAFPQCNPVFLVLCTFFGGAVFTTFFGLMIGVQNIYFMLAAGMVIGYFASLMLMKKSPSVFTGKSFLHLAIFGAVIFASIAVVKSDPMNVVTFIPSAEEIAQADVSWYYNSTNRYFTSDPEEIQQVSDFHEQLFSPQTGQDDSTEYGTTRDVTVTYHLKNGRELHRSYQVSGNLYHQTEWFMHQPESVYGIHSPEDLKGREWTLHFYANYEEYTLTRQQSNQLLEYTIADMKTQDCSYHDFWDESLAEYSVELRVMEEDDYENWHHFTIPKFRCFSRDWADAFVKTHEPDSSIDTYMG